MKNKETYNQSIREWKIHSLEFLDKYILPRPAKYFQILELQVSIL